MTFKKGHKKSVKLKTTDVRLRAYDSYCKHIGEGWSPRGWVFDEGGTTVLWETMEKYIREEPGIFDPAKKKKAEALGFSYWERLGTKGIKGNKGEDKINVPLYQMFMRNKFGWDRDTNTSNHFEPDVRRFLAFWESKAIAPAVEAQIVEVQK